MTTTYTITMKNCAFFARHGLHDAEEFLGQRFFVDAELDVSPSMPLSASICKAPLTHVSRLALSLMPFHTPAY